jgi:plastocyanin
MRIARTLALAAALLLLLAAPASAAEKGVQAKDFVYAPQTRTIDLLDFVKWTFSGEPHTVTARRRQTDYWDSGVLNDGATYRRQFKWPGRFSYFCEVHPVTMKGTLVVGTPEADPPDLSDVHRRRTAHRIRMLFHVNERAVVAMTVARRSGDRWLKRVKRARFSPGDHSIRITGLRSDTWYRVKLVAKDGWRNLSDPVRRRVRTLD